MAEGASRGDSEPRYQGRDRKPSSPIVETICMHTYIHTRVHIYIYTVYYIPIYTCTLYMCIHMYMYLEISYLLFFEGVWAMAHVVGRLAHSGGNLCGPRPQSLRDARRAGRVAYE